MTAKERGNYIKELLSTLTAKEEKILRSYFGIHQPKRYTLEEISKGDQSSREQIKRIKNTGLIENQRNIRIYGCVIISKILRIGILEQTKERLLQLI